MKMCAPLTNNRKNDTGSRKLKLNVKNVHQFAALPGNASYA